MAWTIDFTDKAVTELEWTDHSVRRRIISFLEERVAPLDDPRQIGKALRYDLANLWSYRVGDYPILCDIRETVLTVLVVRVGHRKDVYEN
ncbi:MAG: type II toxin-antitoxin system RelE/ParE family toxin [Acidobacteriia bacterium]|nr:type II toxin-antitoxin system RelE/ParE family toxin [Terriglobia bacterium]